MPTFVYVLIVVVVLIIVQVVRMSLRASSHHFECPDCGKHFQVSRVHYMFTAHSFDGRCQVTCPGCGKTAMLPPCQGPVSGSTDQAES